MLYKLAEGDKFFLLLYAQIGITSNNLHMTIEHKTCWQHKQKILLPGGQMRKDVMMKVMMRISVKGQDGRIPLEDEKVSEKRIVTNSLQISRMGEG